jgi:hypothetical protein
MGIYTKLYLERGGFFFKHPIEVGTRVFHAKRELHGIVTDRQDVAMPGEEQTRRRFIYAVTLTNGEVVNSIHVQLMVPQVGLLEMLAEAAA